MKTVFRTPVSICIVFLFFSGLISSCSFSAKTTERYLNEASAESYDMIVVPGVPFSEGGWMRQMKARVYWSKYLYDKGIAKNIIYSGSSVATPYYEGEIMALYAIAIGIPKEHVFTEIKAEHSTENIYYSYYKARKMGFRRIALATDGLQAKLIKRFARTKVDKDLGIIPIVMDTLKAMEPMMIDPVINYRQAFNENFIPLNARQSYWKRMRGTMGRFIDESYKYDPILP